LVDIFIELGVSVEIYYCLRDYEADLGGNAGKGRPRRTSLDQIRKVLEKGQVKSTRNRRACMRNLMKVEETKGV
jgi:hypothetical protein